MANVIEYNGKDEWKQKATELLNEGTGGGQVDDVKVNGTSVVDENKVAQIDLSEYATQSYVINALDDYTTTAVLQANYYTKTDIDNALQGKANTSDLATVATSGAYADLSNKPTLGTAAAEDFDTVLDQLSNNLITNSAVTWGLLDKASLSDLDNYYTKSQTYDRSEINTIINLETAQKQDTLTEGNGIEIDQNSVIWVKDTAYRFEEGSVDGAFEVTNPSGVPSSIPVHNVIRHGGTLEATQSNPIDFNDEAFRGANARHVYWIGINQYVSNAPVANGNYGNFECFGSMQRFSRYRQTGCGQVFQRHYMNNSWSPWMRMNQDIHTIETDDMTSAVTLTNGSYGTLAQVTLSAGIWQLNARASFASNATGNRAIIVTNSSTSTSSYDSMYVRVPSAGGSHTTGLCVSGCFELAQSTTLYLRGFQNSGGNLNASSASIRAIRIA